MNVWKYLEQNKFEIGREIIISIIISSLIGGSIAFYFNKKIDERIASRQFIYEYSRTFFDNQKYRNISVALENQYLYKERFVTPQGQNFNDYDIDDFYSLIYDIWSFYKEGFISKKLLNEQYVYYLCVIYNAPETKTYRAKLKTEGFTDNYNFLDDIAKEFELNNKDCKTISSI